jgi:uncharacterized protein involved in response to NO
MTISRWHSREKAELHSPRGSRLLAIALLSKGFRPFFLVAAVFAVLAVPVWLLALQGGVRPGGPLGAMHWHAHEMLFGFSAAVVAGFLLTAVSNWTERETAVGLPLLLLAALWLVGRIAMFFPTLWPRPWPAVADLAFLPAVATACARPILAAKNRRNYPFILLLALLALANAFDHLGSLRADVAAARHAQRAALDLVVLLMCLITGRVTPMFTRNALQRPELRSHPPLELATSASLVLLLLGDVLNWPERTLAVLSALAALLAVARMRRWGGWYALGDPLLWVLHVGALWLPIGLSLRAAVGLTPSIPPGSAVHALTAGAIGTLSLGMMARVSLGHTGRALRAPRLATVAFVFVIGAGCLRVLAPFLPPSAYLRVLTVAGALWSGAFAAFVVGYAKILCTPRIARGA